MIGICAYGGYVPRYRLNRELIYKAMGWVAPGNISNAKGEKAVTNFDEDSITMAVSAGIHSLKDFGRDKVDGVYFASTTMPYKERLNAGIITAALGLKDDVRSADFSGSPRAGTNALLSALESLESKRVNNLVVCAADNRLGKPGSPQEMIFGDAAAAFRLGDDDVLAEFKGSFSITYDFGDHYRGEFAKFDRQWEDRWIRDMGYGKFIPEAVNGILSKYNLKVSDFAKIIYPCHYPATRKKLNKMLAITPEMEQDTLQAKIGDCGTAQPLVMLVNALENAKAGDKIMVVSFGSGCDALYFEVTEEIEKKRDGIGITASLATRSELDNYTKYLTWRDILPCHMGLQSEEDLWTRWSTLWRNRKFVMGLIGCKCNNCGTPQLPPQKICVNPECRKTGEMEEYNFSDKTGRITSFTGDMLISSYNPPAIYGKIDFEGGGRHFFDFTDCDLDELKTGMAVSMSFRRKYHDQLRDISGYFWKAVPTKEVR
jgi:hydroxymethylglutaryl-CoA synthase